MFLHTKEDYWTPDLREGLDGFEAEGARSMIHLICERRWKVTSDFFFLLTKEVCGVLTLDTRICRQHNRCSTSTNSQSLATRVSCQLSFTTLSPLILRTGAGKSPVLTLMTSPCNLRPLHHPHDPVMATQTLGNQLTLITGCDS